MGGQLSLGRFPRLSLSLSLLLQVFAVWRPAGANNWLPIMRINEPPRPARAAGPWRRSLGSAAEWASCCGSGGAPLVLGKCVSACLVGLWRAGSVRLVARRGALFWRVLRKENLKRKLEKSRARRGEKRGPKRSQKQWPQVNGRLMVGWPQVARALSCASLGPMLRANA